MYIYVFESVMFFGVKMRNTILHKIMCRLKHKHRGGEGERERERERERVCLCVTVASEGR